MNRKAVILLIAAAFLSVGLVVGRMYYLDKVSSPLSPEISFDEEVLMVSVNATEKELLKGVTATDPEDGDVTDSLLVESTSNIINGDSVKVSYVAFDSNNHMSRAERTVRYTDYKSPEFGLTQPLVFRLSNTINTMNYISATDAFDGDISRKIIYNMGTEGTLFTVGEHEVELRVINSKGDISHLTLNVEITQDDPNPANIQLKEYLCLSQCKR